MNAFGKRPGYGCGYRNGIPPAFEKHLFHELHPAAARGMSDRLKIGRGWRKPELMRVDPDKRRKDIAQVTIDLVAREGLAAATFRRIAAEGSWSTASITNYFVDKQDLLVWTFQVLSVEGERRFEEALDISENDPVPALLTMVPWCPANVRRWKAYLAFWDAAVRDPELAALLADSTSVGMDLLERLVSRSLRAGAGARGAVELLNATIQGVALQMLVDHRGWSEAKIRAILLESHKSAIGRFAAASSM